MATHGSDQLQGAFTQFMLTTSIRYIDTEIAKGKDVTIIFVTFLVISAACHVINGRVHTAIPKNGFDQLARDLVGTVTAACTTFTIVSFSAITRDIPTDLLSVTLLFILISIFKWRLNPRH